MFLFIHRLVIFVFIGMAGINFYNTYTPTMPVNPYSIGTYGSSGFGNNPRVGLPYNAPYFGNNLGTRVPYSVPFGNSLFQNTSFDYGLSKDATPQTACVKKHDVQNAIYYQKGINPNVGSEGTVMDTVKAMPFIIPVMGGIMASLSAVGMWGGSFENFKKNLHHKFAEIKCRYSGKSFTHAHYQRVQVCTEQMLDGLKGVKDEAVMKKVGEAKKILKDVKLRKVRSEGIDKAAEKILKAETLANEARLLKPTIKEPAKGFFHKIGRAICAPFRAINNSQAMRNFSKTSLGKWVYRSGGPIFAVIDSALETFMEIIPAFKQGGFISGIKQIGKSAVKICTSMAGFMAGEAVGAPIGAIIGSAFGPIGAWLGGFIGGMVCGSIASIPAIKLTKAVIGKNEKELIAQRQAAQEAEQIMHDPEALKELAAKNLEMAQQEIQSGSKRRETKEALTFCAKVESGLPA